MGRLGEAREAYTQGLARARELGIARLDALFEAGLGGLAVAEGRVDEGLAAYARSLDLLVSAADGVQHARHQMILGRTLVEAGRAADAVGTLRASIDQSRERGYRVNVWQAQLHLSRALEALGDTAGALAAPERDLPRPARRGGDEHAIAGNALDAPARCAELEDLARARLVDHLLVELAHAAAAVAVAATIAAPFAAAPSPLGWCTEPARRLAFASGSSAPPS
jgi:tetratricopeptide (TPR) repeat protein